MSEKRKTSILMLLMSGHHWWNPALLLWEVWSNILWSLYICSFFKSNAAKIQSTYHESIWINILHSQPISHYQRVLGGIKVCGELWGLGREPDPVPSGYRVSSLCPCTGVALQLPEAEQAAQSSAGVHGVPRNWEQQWLCLTIIPLELRQMLFSHFIAIDQKFGII